jgi:hypothetical protein
MPGTGNLASGQTSLIIQRALQCDQTRILERLKNVQCPLPRPSNGSATAASILEIMAAKGCPPTPQELLTYPQKATTSGINTLAIQNNTVLCGITGVNRVIVAPCPGPTAAQLNSTTPKPSVKYCYSKRIYN